MMFVFEDIMRLDDRSMQAVLGEVDTKDLALALKPFEEDSDISKKVYDNMSQRAGENLKEEAEFLGPVRVRDVDAAQGRVIAVIRRLEEEEKIVISFGGEGDELIE
jgi:flagellar motor switch protein FliG